MDNGRTRSVYKSTLRVSLTCTVDFNFEQKFDQGDHGLFWALGVYVEIVPLDC